MTPLSSRERLDRCYRHIEVDRPGLYLRGVTESSPRHPSYKPLRDLGVALADLKAHWGCEDLVESPSLRHETKPHSDEFEICTTVLHTPAGELRSSRLVGLKGQPGFHQEHFLKTVEDAEKYLSIPLPGLGGDASSFFDLDAQMGDRGIVEADVGLNPAGMVADLFGSAQFAVFSIEHRDVLHALMKHRMDCTIHILKFVVSKGVGPYFAMLGEEYITPPLHGADDFSEFNVRYDRPVADLIHGAGALLHIHSHGPLRDVLTGFVELGADVLHPIEPPPMGNVTPRMAKDVFRGKVCIEGNIQIGDMYTEDAETIRARVASLIEDAFDDHRDLIVCPTASPYVPEMSQQCYDNYAAVVDVVTNWPHSPR